jgi:hypothetical protein
MTQQDLRVGNYMINFLGEVFQVNGMTIADWGVPSEFKKPKPIPLTLELLNKFRFYSYQNGMGISISVGYFFKLVWNQGEKTWEAFIAWDYTSKWIVNINYVHELQNLYFALKTEDLTIKP